MNKCWLLMGGNMGDRVAFINSAQNQINNQIGKVISESKLYESEAWGLENQQNFLNKVIIVESDLSAIDILNKCLEIEVSLGRERLEKWAERKIDIDILYFAEETVNESHLTIPHPEIQNRRFVLVPLCEISPDYIHPIFNQDNSNLLEKCKDELKVWEYDI